MRRLQFLLTFLLALSALVPHAAMAHAVAPVASVHGAMPHHMPSHDQDAAFGDCIGCAMPDQNISAPEPITPLRSQQIKQFVQLWMPSYGAALDPPPPRDFA